MNHAEPLHNDACFIVITTAVKVLAWLKKTTRKDAKNHVLPICQFAALAMLSGDVDIPVGWGSIEMRQVDA